MKTVAKLQKKFYFYEVKQIYLDFNKLKYLHCGIKMAF